VIPFYRWFGIRLRRDWSFETGQIRPHLSLRSIPNPGFYMLSVLYRGEQTRCYGLFRASQGRVLVDGRLRRRLVRIRKGVKQVHFELYGLNGDASVAMLRLVPQPSCRVRRLLRLKLLRLHPGYGSGTPRRSLAKLWSDYNRLLCRGNRHLVGYDEWIERRERPAFAQELPASQAPDQTPGTHPVLRFLPGIWGEAPQGGDGASSRRSLELQLDGPFERLDPSQAAEIEAPDTWLVLLQAGDQLAPQAFRHFHQALLLHPQALVLYADEDRLTRAGRRHSPQFKPAWNQDLLYGDPHYSHCWLIRSDLAQRVARDLDAAGETLSLYSLVLAATAAAQPQQIVHVPEILYHRADRPGEARGDANSAAILERFLARRGQPVAVTPRAGGGHCLHWPLPDPPPLVSIIIPTRDRTDLLSLCLDSLEATATDDLPTELLVIDNGSSEPTCLAYLEALQDRPAVRLLRRPGPFNFSALNNEAASFARGEVLAFLNNDIEAIQPGWLKNMVVEALRPGIGAVGARLLYEDGSIQHAGVLLGIGGVAGHAHKYADGESEGYQLRLRLTHQLSAVTAAAMVLRKSVFEEVAGFDAEHFAVSYNDVDLCLRLMEAGYRNLYCSDAVLLHHESRTRGAPSSPESIAAWQSECQQMYRRWGNLLRSDPCYSPHLSLVEENFSLAFCQEAVWPRAGLVSATAGTRPQ